jgi:NAD(P)-dependent dehydrogenase (short-subunit alcohol dehydrogenase family)
VKAALPALRRGTGSSVILTESTSAYYPGRGGVLYVSSKFAVRGLVTALAHELAPEIRVNGVAPGGTLHTDLRGLTSLGLGERSLGAVPGRETELAGRVPLKVALSGADHAWSYVFLASERSRGITGDVVHSDGGIAVKTLHPRLRYQTVILNY